MRKLTNQTGIFILVTIQSRGKRLLAVILSWELEREKNMNYLNKLERKFGRYAIPNLSKWLIFGYAVGYMLYYVERFTQLQQQVRYYRV